MGRLEEIIAKVFEIDISKIKKEIKKRCQGTYNFKRDYELLQKAKKRVPSS